MIRPGILLGMLAALALALTWAAPATAQQSDARRVARLEADVVHGEDVNAIKELNRAYGYYVDGGLWDDVADLFADDAVANYPNGTWVGRDSIRAHLIQNLGGGRIGLGDGRLYIHTILQPVVHLDPRDHAAVDPDPGRLGRRWACERQNSTDPEQQLHGRSVSGFA